MFYLGELSCPKVESYEAIAINPSRAVLNEDHEMSSSNCASMRCSRPIKASQCKKRVIMGSDFLLVRRNGLSNLDQGKKFHFFHGPSRSVVEVQDKDSFVASKLELSKSMLPREVSHIVKEEVVLMDGWSETLSPSDLEGVSSPVSDGVRTTTKVNVHPDDANPRKRRRNKANFKDNPTFVHLHGTRERKKIGRVKDGGLQDKATENPTRTKRKRDRVIEDSYSDPHVFRIPQRHTLH
ncbi:hypothetical protein RHMOL_Rhmol10G0020700 [Rhododendron molle]|uniref:Uncharacterized protein n=1 Tax=Rhododendron molle TaxID=49168 RepID=A0ACC0LY19_RHOML|nr:hypothetical protein RHMOL_Rhmol10G0020700 [Rhododendron molle]